MPAASDIAFCFGKYTLDMRRGCLRAGSREIALRPKSFKVLQHLVENAGRLVSKEELITAAWPNVIVTDESISRCVSDVRLALADSDQLMVKTIPRRGYRFTELVVRSAACDSPEPVNGGCVPEAAHDQNVLAVPAKADLEASSRRLSLVVLPFANLGGNSAEDHLAEIITDGLTVHLSRIGGPSVVARSTASAYKGRAMDIRQVGRELRVRYVLEGSEQHADMRLRVSARLIDTRTGAHLWADQFETDRTDLLRMQEVVATRLTRALQIELLTVEASRARRSVPNAENLSLQAEAIFLQYGMARDEVKASYDLCERALRMDPKNARALGILAEKYATRVTALQSVTPSTDLARAEELASRALASAPRSCHAHHVKARVLIAQRHHEEAAAEAERSLGLNPSFIPAYLNLSHASLFRNRPEESLAHAETALRLSPLDPCATIFHAFRGYAYFRLRDDDRAIGCLRQALADHPAFPTPTAWLAGALALTGRERQARDVLRCYFALRGTKTRTIADWKSLALADDSAYHAFRERLYTGLRTAGMPEK